MAFMNADFNEWGFRTNQAKIKEKFHRTKLSFKVLTYLEYVRHHPEVRTDYLFTSELNTLIVEVETFAEHTTDLYADQKTTEDKYNLRDISFQGLVYRTESIVRRSNIPERDFVILALKNL